MPRNSTRQVTLTKAQSDKLKKLLSDLKKFMKSIKIEHFEMQYVTGLEPRLTLAENMKPDVRLVMLMSAGIAAAKKKQDAKLPKSAASVRIPLTRKKAKAKA